MAKPCHWCSLVDEGMDLVHLPHRSQLPCDLAHLLSCQYIFLQPVTHRQKSIKTCTYMLSLNIINKYCK